MLEVIVRVVRTLIELCPEVNNSRGRDHFNWLFLYNGLVYHCRLCFYCYRYIGLVPYFSTRIVYPFIVSLRKHHLIVIMETVMSVVMIENVVRRGGICLGVHLDFMRV